MLTEQKETKRTSPVGGGGSKEKDLISAPAKNNLTNATNLIQRERERERPPPEPGTEKEEPNRRNSNPNQVTNGERRGKPGHDPSRSAAAAVDRTGANSPRGHVRRRIPGAAIYFTRKELEATRPRSTERWIRGVGDGRRRNLAAAEEEEETARGPELGSVAGC